MTSKIVVNNIEPDSGISSVTFTSNIAGEDSTQNISGINSVTAVSFHGIINGAASGLTGVLPAISGANLTNIPTVSDINNLINNVAMLGFKVAVNGSLAKYNLVDQVVDEFTDATGIDASASTNESLQGSSGAKYYFGGAMGSPTTTTQTYSYTGSDVTISVGSGQVVTGTVKLWGAAGGQDSSPNSSYGGGGAFASGVLNYTSSDGADLIVSVGLGGFKGQEAGSGGSGGGYTGIFFGSKTHGNTLMIAGAGGGSGDNSNMGGGTGGAFGATAGNGLRNGSDTYGGKGGTQSAGGAKGGSNGAISATDGAALLGGNGGADETLQTSRPYNGGGIQGEEPGGTQGGGGGGSGYYGGGGGNGGPSSGNGSGGGGSSYYNTGSYWSGTPTSTAGSTNTSGGASDSNYPGGGVGSGSSGGSGGANTGNNGGNGAAYVSITVQTLSFSDLTLQSVDATASSAPSTADLVMLIENGAGTATLNTDIKGFISRDSGANFTQGTLVDEGTWGTTAKRILAFHDLDISGQPSGTSVCYKITTHNQTASKSTRIHAVSHGWK